MSDCIFCKIAGGVIPAKIVYEDDYCKAFQDINPVSPVHILFITKKHIESLNHLEENDSVILGNVLSSISKYAKENGLDKNGYRVVNNMSKDGGQTVFHIHFHLLSGRPFNWPPG